MNNLTCKQIQALPEVETSRAREIIWSRAYWLEKLAETEKLATNSNNAWYEAISTHEPIEVVENVSALASMFEEMNEDAKTSYANIHTLYLCLCN